jgi:hypothetical protein
MSLSSAETPVLIEKITLEKKLVEKLPPIFPDGSAYRQLQIIRSFEDNLCH